MEETANTGEESTYEQNVYVEKKFYGKVFVIIYTIVLTLGMAGYIYYDMFWLKNSSGVKNLEARADSLKTFADSLKHIIDMDTLQRYVNYTTNEIEDLIKGLDENSKNDLIRKQKKTITILDEAVKHRDEVIKSHGDNP